MNSPEIQNEFNAIADKYAARLVKNVQEVLSRPNYRRTGELESSLKITVVRATPTEPPKIILTYADQGFYIGYKSPMWTKMPPVRVLEEWAQSVNFSGPIPGYKDASKSNLPPWKILKRRAFAIAMSKKKFDIHKPKRWKRAANLGDLLKDLNGETFEQFAREVENVIVKTLTKKD